MKRLSDNRDLFEAPGGEVITVKVEATKIPYAATFSDLESRGTWTKVQSPTPANPVEIRTFTMPTSSRELFVITYGFPPAAQTPAGAEYDRTLSGGGTTDGPKTVFPPPSGSSTGLSYEFRLPGAAVESTDAPAAKKKAPAKKVVSKKAPATKSAVKKDAAKKAAPTKKAVKKPEPKATANKGAKRGGRK